jgi:hypothetical protein
MLLLDCAASLASRALCVSSSTLVNWDKDGNTGEGLERRGEVGLINPPVFKRGPDGNEAVLL